MENENKVDKTELRIWFDEMAARHRRETRYASSVNRIMENPHMREIVSLGDDIIPLILEEMETGQSSIGWIVALGEITGVDPTAGDVELLTGTWIRWGEMQRKLFKKYLDEDE